MNKKLIAFLKKNGAYDAFVKNLEDPICDGAGIKNLHPFPIRTLIARAFVWVATPEGWYFWHEIGVKWLCICNK